MTITVPWDLEALAKLTGAANMTSIAKDRALVALDSGVLIEAKGNLMA